MSKVSSAASAAVLTAAINASANIHLAEVSSPDIGDAIEHPAGTVRCGEQRGIADRRPQEAPEPVTETGDRVPRRRGRRVDAEAQPAVPRKVLELHGTD